MTSGTDSALHAEAAVLPPWLDPAQLIENAQPSCPLPLCPVLTLLHLQRPWLSPVHLHFMMRKPVTYLPADRQAVAKLLSTRPPGASSLSPRFLPSSPLLLSLSLQGVGGHLGNEKDRTHLQG